MLLEAFGYGPLGAGPDRWLTEREGLDAQIVVMRGTPITLQALATESINVANAGTGRHHDRRWTQAWTSPCSGSLLNNLSMSLVAAKPYKPFRRSARQDHRLRRRSPTGNRICNCACGAARLGGLEYPRDYQILMSAASPTAIPRCGVAGHSRGDADLSAPPRQHGPGSGVSTCIGYFADDIPHYFSILTPSSAPGPRKTAHWWCAS